MPSLDITNTGWQFDCKIEIYPPETKGGQKVGTVSGVKITHIPTGLVAISENSSSQFVNRGIAFDMIEGGLMHPRVREKLHG